MIRKSKNFVTLFLFVALFVVSSVGFGLNAHIGTKNTKVNAEGTQDLIFKSELCYYVGAEPWAEITYNYSNWSLPVTQEKKNIQDENGAAPYTDDKYSGFYDYILINGLTYEDYADKYGDPLGIRICLPGSFRVGLPNGQVDTVITFLAGFSPFYWAGDDGIKVDESYNLANDFTVVTGVKWSEVTTYSKIVFGKAPTVLNSFDTGAFLAYPIKNYSAPLTSGQVTYSSSDSNVVEINETTGEYTVKRSGTVDITATFEGKSVVKSYTIDSCISLDKSEICLKVNDTFTLTATHPDCGTISSWSSSNESIATVDTNGKVIGVSAGEAEITVTLNNGDSAICKVIVAEGNAIFIKTEKNTMTIAEKLSLNILTNSDLAVNWAIVTADSGKLESATGEINKFTPSICGKITIKATLNGTEVSDSVEITVLSTVSFITKSVKIAVDGNYKLSYSVYPKTTQFSFVSSDTSIATVDQEGNVKGVSKGTAEITITTEDGQTSKIPVTVYNNVYVSVSSANLSDKATLQIMFSASPYVNIKAKTNLEQIAQSDDIPEALEQYFSKIIINGKNFMDFCSDFEVAYIINMHLGQVNNLLNMPAYSNNLPYSYPDGTTIVFEKGLILPEFTDNVWILSEYVLEDNYIYEINSSSITIPKVTGVEFSQTEISLENGKQQTLNPEFTGNQYIASYFNPQWSSSVTDVVTVSSDGIIKALKEGKSTITYSLGELKATITVNVTAARVFSFEEDSVTIKIGSEQTLTVNGIEEGDKLIWSTSDDKIVTVDENGTIKGVAEGSATISIKVNGQTITCEVTVSKKTGCNGSLNMNMLNIITLIVSAMLILVISIKRKRNV